jgi:hypothetical protein
VEQTEQQASTGMSANHLVTRSVGFVIGSSHIFIFYNKSKRALNLERSFAKKKFTSPKTMPNGGA